MTPFTRHTGIVAVLDRVDVDTDQIIPKQFLKRVERSGYGEFLFHDWRYAQDGSLRPAFELNRKRYQGASVLVTGRNFGCGSSREHAVWALMDYGFRAVLAPSFADIFRTNCCKNGLLPVALSEHAIRAHMDTALTTTGYKLTVDLEELRVHDGSGLSARFEMDEFTRKCFLLGLDEIALTLQHQVDIEAFEARRPEWLPVVQDTD